MKATGEVKPSDEKTTLEKAAITFSIISFIVPFLQFLKLIPIKLDSIIGLSVDAGLFFLCSIFWTMLAANTSKTGHYIFLVIFFIFFAVKLSQLFPLVM